MKDASAMNDTQEEIGKKAGAALSTFLSDFAPRRIADEDVEVLPFDEPIHPDIVETAVDFPQAAEEEMSPLDEKPLMSEPKVDVEQIRREAFEQAVEQTTSELQTKFADEKRVLEEQQTKALADMKQNTVNELAANMQSDLSNGLAMVLDTIGNDVAKVLATFIGNKLSDDALRDFAARIADQAVSAGQPMVVEGNAELLDALSRQAGFDATKFELRANDSADIRLRQGDAVIATRLDPLIVELKELVR
ncbi:hypothetical protein [Bartonella sp. LJL80]